MIGLGKFVVGAVAAAGVSTTVVVAVAQESTAVDQAIVTRVIDGDTFDAEIDGRTERIRLLNVDTPETKHPDETVQCLGPEATEFLQDLLPVGSTVSLEYDDERIDQYDRTLAGVRTGDGTLVNAEIARQGLATAVVFGSNDRFYPPVLEAQQEAVAKGRGLYSDEVACTIPGRVAAVTAAVENAPAAAAQPADAPSGDLRATAGEVASVLDRVIELEKAFAGESSGLVWAALSEDDRRRFAAAVTSARSTAEQKESELRSKAEAAEQREAEAAERERQAREAREREEREARERKAREQREAREAKAAAERRRAEQTAPAPAPRKSEPKPEARPKKKDSSPGGSPYPGYNGPRCYEPGGKVWHPC